MSLCWLHGVDEVMPEVARIAEIYVHPGANFRYRNDTVRILGKAILTTSAQRHWDEELGTYNELTASLIGSVETRWAPVPDQRLTLDAVGGISTSSYDGTGDPVGGLRGEWLATMPTISNRIEAAVAIDQVDLVQIGKPYRRADIVVLDHVTWEGPAATISVMPQVLQQRMQEDTPYHSGAEADLRGAALIANYLRTLGTRQTWDFRAEGRIIERLHPGRYQDGAVARLTATVALQPSELTTIDAGLGLAYWRFSDNFQGDPAWDDATVLEPEFHLAVGWDYREGSTLELQLRRYTDLGLGANVATMTQIMPSWTHRFPERWRLQVQIAHLHVDLHDQEERTEWAVQTKLDFHLDHGGILRWYLVGTESDSRIAPDFWRIGTSLQALLVF